MDRRLPFALGLTARLLLTSSPENVSSPRCLPSYQRDRLQRYPNRFNEYLQTSGARSAGR